MVIVAAFIKFRQHFIIIRINNNDQRSVLIFTGRIKLISKLRSETEHCCVETGVRVLKRARGGAFKLWMPDICQNWLAGSAGPQLLHVSSA